MANVATNMAQLEKMILDEMESAMTATKAKSEHDVEYELAQFYTQGKPKVYKRTYQLKNSMRSYGLHRFGKTIDFYIWLDQTVPYEVPNMDFIKIGYASYYSTPMVFNAAENHTSNILGKGGFWSRSLKKIKQNMITSMKSHF